MESEIDSPRLLSPLDPDPVIVDSAGSLSAFLLTCDHAGRQIPERLGSLGVAEDDLRRHIAWDIGAGEVARLLAEKLSSPCIRQRYSRLVVDCNRSPGHPQSIALQSEYTEVPGNRDLSEAETAARLREIFWPYHRAIAAELDRRDKAGIATAVVAVHSFTPVYAGAARPWHAGVLHGRDSRLASAVKALLQEQGFHVGDNEPYQLSDESDFTIPYHAEARHLAYVELEIRQDLIELPPQQEEWAKRLSLILPIAWQQLD